VIEVEDPTARRWEQERGVEPGWERVERRAGAGDERHLPPGAGRLAQLDHLAARRGAADVEEPEGT
jgi:hypothetical protein